MAVSSPSELAFCPKAWPHTWLPQEQWPSHWQIIPPRVHWQKWRARNGQVASKRSAVNSNTRKEYQALIFKSCCSTRHRCRHKYYLLDALPAHRRSPSPLMSDIRMCLEILPRSHN
eukprot:2677242-Amphidinium_carterae.1